MYARNVNFFLQWKTYEFLAWRGLGSIDSSCLNACLPQSTDRKLRSAKSFIRRYLLDLSTSDNNIYPSKEKSPLEPRKASLEVRKLGFLFPFITRIVFDKKESFAPKLISSLEWVAFSLFFEWSIIKHIYRSFTAPKGVSQSEWIGK